MARRMLLLDTGKEWGGGTNSMIELLKRLDHARFAVSACFYHDYPHGSSTLAAELAAIGVPLIVMPVRSQPLWAKIAKELLRGLLGWHRRWRAAAVFRIELCWRIRPRARALAEVLRRGEYTLLYMNNQPASNLEGYLAAMSAGVAVVQHCRVEPVVNAFERDQVNRAAAAVLCVSEGVRDALIRQGVRGELCQVIHNGIDVSQAMPDAQRLPGVAPGMPVVGVVASLLKRKAVDHLLRAVARLPAAMAPHVLVVGDGPEAADLRGLADALGLSSATTFAGFQARPLPWLMAMDILVLSSPSEGFPRVVLEAMLLGKPVVAARNAGTTALVEHAVTGYLYDFGDIDALSRQLAVLLNHADLRRAFGEAGRRRVIANFSIERYVAGVTAALEAA